ncbi:hypothetical protein Tco_0815311, partial [Tanacetum coccineum]
RGGLISYITLNFKHVDFKNVDNFKSVTSKASTLKASTSKASNSKATTSKASTLKASSSKRTSKASTSKASFSQERNDSYPSPSTNTNTSILDSLLCPICGSVPEDASHFLFQCGLSKLVFRKICRWWDLVPNDMSSFSDWDVWFSGIRLPCKLNLILEGVFYVAWWHIWRFRNQSIFVETPPRRLVLFDDIVSHAFDWCMDVFLKKKLYLSWDLEKIARMNAYANTNVSKVAIEAGFSVTSVPARSASAADTSLIIDLCRLELEQPSIVVLISGEADYCEMKPFSIENVMLVNMLSMATGTRVACDFVILTRKDLSQVIHFLRTLGHSVTTAMPLSFDQSLHLMRDALNNKFIWHNWEAAALKWKLMKI